MGGAWCKADRGSRPYSPKGPWNSAISRWTDHVRNVYRRPKAYNRKPPRPPQKPMMTNERLTIGPPRLISDQSSDGWRTMTLTVPDAAPVPPPRKKRKRHADLARTAYSMGDLTGGPPDPALAASTLSLPAEEGLASSGVYAVASVESMGVIAEDRTESRGVHAEDSVEKRVDIEGSLESKGDHAWDVKSKSFSTFLVAPVIERLNDQEEVDVGAEENKENQPREDAEDEEDTDIIIPVEKETLFSSRTMLQSNLGYIDKLSAISEASAESGYDDRADFSRTTNSEMSESQASSPDPVVAELNELNRDIRERTAISKAAWLRGILGEDDGDGRPPSERRGSLGTVERFEDVQGIKDLQHASLPTHMHLDDREVEFTVRTPPSPPPSPTNHSVLLGFLQKNSDKPEPYQIAPREETIFLTNTRTNIIYKTLSKDNLTDGCEVNVAFGEKGCDREGAFKSPTDGSETNHVKDSSSTTLLTDCAFRAPRSVDQDVEKDADHRQDRCFVSDLKTLQVSLPVIVVNGVSQDAQITKSAELSEKKTVKEPEENRESTPSSRKSSITDSLHEFEMSIYDMLNESKKNRDSSDEEESLKTVNFVANK